MRILCAIVSHAKSTRRDTLRKTWIPLAPSNVDVIFFVGAQDGELEEGVVNLHCCDNHEGLPDKVRAICRWALDHGYEYVWKVDDDVQLNPARLAELPFPFTAVVLEGAAYPYISGFLYGFDITGMKILSNSAIPVYSDGWDCGYYQDEYWVADKLGKAGIPCTLITKCGVVHYEWQKAFPPFWVVAVHGESVPSRSLDIFKQLNHQEQPDLSRRLRRRQ